VLSDPSRRLIDRAIDLPIIGSTIGVVLVWFVQIDTVKPL